MEANIVRPFVTRALQTFYKLSSPDMIQDSDSVSNRQPQTANRGPRVSFHSRIFVSWGLSNCIIRGAVWCKPCHWLPVALATWNYLKHI